MDKQEIRKNVLAEIKTILRRNYADVGKNISDDAHLVSDLRMDYLDILTMVVDFEEKLSIFCSEKEQNTMLNMTVGGLIEFINRKAN